MIASLFQDISLCLVVWKSRKQTRVALCTAKAEYVALANAAQEVIWMRQLMENLECKQREPTVDEDNQAAICIAQNPQYHNEIKHIDIKYNVVREKVADSTI